MLSRREAVGEQDQRVEILELLGADGIGGSRNAISTPGALLQRREIEIGIGRRAVGLAEIAGQSDAEGRLIACSLPSWACRRRAQLADRLGQRVVQHPDVAGIADEVEALAG